VSVDGSTMGPSGPHVCPHPSSSAAVARSLRSMARCSGVWPLSVRALMFAPLCVCVVCACVCVSVCVGGWVILGGWVCGCVGVWVCGCDWDWVRGWEGRKGVTAV